MDAKDKLHELVHSLTPSEKRYVKIHLSHNESNEKGNYRLLLDAVSGMKTYDEGVLRLTLKGTTVSKNLSVTKHYLYGHILKSLELYHHRADVDKQLCSFKSQIQILQAHGLNGQACALMDKALKLAKEHEKHMDVAELALWRLKAMTSEYELRDLDRKLADAHQTVSDALDRIRQHSILSYLDTKALLLIKKYGIVRDEQQQALFEGLVNDPSMTDSRQVTFMHRYYYNHILSLYHFAMENDRENLMHRKALVDLFELNPERRSSHQDLYITALNNYILICNQMGMREEFCQWLDILESLRPANINDKVKAFTNANTMRLMDAFGRNEFQDVIDRAPMILDRLREYGTKVDLSNRMLFHYVIAVSYVGAGRHQEALTTFHTLLNTPHCEEIQDLYRFSRLLLLVVHYKLGNDRILEAQLHATQRYLRTKKKLYRGESLLLELVRSLQAQPDARSQQAAFTGFLKDYRDLQQDSYEKRVSSYFPFEQWAELELEGL